MLQFLFFKKNIDSLAAAIVGFIIIFLFTRHGGIGVGPDSVVYSTTALNLHNNGTLTDFAHNPLIIFPAFYPMFLNGLMWLTGLRPLLFAPVANALLFAVVIYLSGYIMEQFSFPSKWYKAALLSCIVLSPCLLEVYSMLWSETVFILWLLLFIIAMHRYFQFYSRKALIAAAIIASFACITRYAGITIIGTGGILLLLDMKLPLRRKLADILIFSAISPLLLIINLARNYAVTGMGTGMREKSNVLLSENLRNAGSVFSNWLPFLNGHYTLPVWAFVFIIAGLACICLYQLIRRQRLTYYEDIAALFSFVYISFMVITASISRFETLNSRFFSPVFIPLIWSGSIWIIYVGKKISLPKRKWWFAFGSIIFLCFQYGQLAADYETWDGVKDAGIPGYTEDQWRYSQTVQFIKKDTLLYRNNYTVYSNAYDAVYFFTKEPGKYLPHKEYKPGIQNFLNDRHCYVVWFTDGEDDDLISMAFIKQVKKMKLLKQLNDGAVYEYDK